jgi:hypothetical protein
VILNKRNLTSPTHRPIDAQDLIGRRDIKMSNLHRPNPDGRPRDHLPPGSGTQPHTPNYGGAILGEHPTVMPGLDSKRY